MKISIVSYNIEGLTLEYNYCQSQDLKNYIIEKSIYLNKYLPELAVDIICIQEYTPILNLDFGDYYTVKDKSNAVFFRKNKFTYVKHIVHKLCGLIVTLDSNGFILKLGTNRFAPSNDGLEQRATTIKILDSYAKNKIFIYAADTNMKKAEEKDLNNLVDCYHAASLTTGHYTLDKRTNPYFASDYANKTRTRYDKIFCTNVFDCEQFVVLHPANDGDLVHEYYPFGGISDHYPVLAILSIG